jgi:hypothetical protein
VVGHHWCAESHARRGSRVPSAMGCVARCEGPPGPCAGGRDDVERGVDTARGRTSAHVRTVRTI